MAKLWGGRFSKNTDAFAEGFHSSISFVKPVKMRQQYIEFCPFMQFFLSI